MKNIIDYNLSQIVSIKFRNERPVEVIESEEYVDNFFKRLFTKNYEKRKLYKIDSIFTSLYEFYYFENFLTENGLVYRDGKFYNKSYIDIRFTNSQQFYKNFQSNEDCLEYYNTLKQRLHGLNFIIL
jgi:hypothetical protein